MRRAACLVVAGIAAASFVACSDAGIDGDPLAARRAHSGVPAPGSAQEHDDGDTAGETAQDTGNPNADTTPEAPAEQGTAAGEFSVAVDNSTPAADLGSAVDIDVTVEPKGGFSGGVDLTVSGLPAGVKGTFNPAQVSVASGAATSKLTLTVPVGAVPSAPSTSSPLVISAKSGTIAATANANFKINPKIVLTIPMNIDALRKAGVGTVYRDEWGTAFGSTQTPLATQVGNGVVVTVFNADSTSHIIHGANGFQHGDTGNPIKPNAFELQNGKPRTRTLNVGANTNGYLHEGASGPSVSFRIKVVEAQ